MSNDWDHPFSTTPLHESPSNRISTGIATADPTNMARVRWTLLALSHELPLRLACPTMSVALALARTEGPPSRTLDDLDATNHLLACVQRVNETESLHATGTTQTRSEAEDDWISWDVQSHAPAPKSQRTIQVTLVRRKAKAPPPAEDPWA